jgi:hypothetical protein
MSDETITDERLNYLEQLLAMLPEGRWCPGGGPFPGSGPHVSCEMVFNDDGSDCDDVDPIAFCNVDDVADFIAEARNQAGALVAEVRRLRGEAQAMREVVEAADRWHDESPRFGTRFVRLEHRLYDAITAYRATKEPTDATR